MPRSRTVLHRSPRLYLARLVAADASALARWFNDPEVFGHLRDLREVVDVADRRRWVRAANQDPSWRVFAVIHARSHRLIGYGGFTNVDLEDRKAEVGLVIGEPAFRGRGLGAEALWLLCRHGFDVLGLHNILGENYADNPIAIANARKIGLRHLGTRRQSRRIGDRVLDVHYSDLLPHELIDPTRRRRR